MLSLPARLALFIGLFVVTAAPWRASCAEVAPPAASAGYAITQVDLPADKVQAIEQAAPDQAPAKPAQPRKVLVYGRAPTHAQSVPLCFKAIEILGKKTGAFETVCSGDPAVFLPENLRQFDAVVMNSTHELRPFLPPDLLQWPKYKDQDLDTAQQTAIREKEAACQKSLLEFVRGGRGLVGIHGATCMVQWPEYFKMLGGKYACHFVDKVWIRTEEPGTRCARP